MPESPPTWTTPTGRTPAAAATLPRSARRFAVASVAAGLAGVLAGMLTWLGPAPDPYFVPLWVTQYRSPVFPPAPAAEADRLAVQTGTLFRRGPDAYASQEAALLLRQLQDLETLPSVEAVVVYLHGYAAPGANGSVALFPADADPPRSLNALDLADVIRRVAGCPARRKLLVLDLAEPDGDVRAGAVRADVPARLPALLATTATQGANLQVLTACGPGQVAQSMPAEGRTAFGWYFERGLRGAALAYHQPDHPEDGRVSVHELARFLLTRVDRWARDNRGTRQTPFLLGDGSDFDLSAPGPPAPETPLPDPAKAIVMPGWLADGWAELDRWRADGTLSESPRLFRRLEAAVRRADMAAVGPTADRAAADLRFARARIDDELRTARAAVPKPTRFVSLAMAEAGGQRPDPELDKAASQLLVEVRATPPGKPADVAKLVAGFLKAAGGKSAFVVEAAIYAAAVGGSEGRPDLLAVLDQVLKGRDAAPMSAECRFLARLADLGTRVPADRWPGDIARQALTAVRDAERVAARPDLYPWAGRLMDKCVELRTEAESLLAFWGEIPDNELESRVRRAGALAGELLAFADAVRAARRTADESLAAATSGASLLDRYPNRVPAWRDRLRAAAELVAALVPPPGQLTESELLPRADAFRRLTARTEQAKLELYGGSPADLEAWLVGRAARADAGPDVLAGLETGLKLPLVPLAERVRMRTAAAELAGKLTTATRGEDAADDEAGVAVPPLPLTPAEADEARHAEAHRAAVRTRVGVEILRLAGVSAERLDGIEKALSAAVAAGPDSPSWDADADGLRSAWGDGLRDAVAAADPTRLDLLAAVAPGDEPFARLDAPPGGPRFAAAKAAAPAYLGWLASRYLYLVRIGLDAPVYENALADLGPAAGGPVLAGSLTAPTEAVSLSSARPVGEARLALTRPATDPDPPTVRPLVPDGYWLRATAAVTDSPPDPTIPDHRSSVVLVRVELVGPRPTTTAPAGVVLEFRHRGRAAFARLPVELGPDAPPVDVLVSRSADDPTDVGDAVRLRPSEAAQPLFVFARNRTSTARPVVVRLGGAVSSVEAKVTVPPGATVPVPFVLAAPPAGGGGPVALPAAVRVELLDDDKAAAVLRDRTVRIDAADPLEYVEAASAAFEPARLPDRPANRLRFGLRARRTLGPPACVAELALDPAEIPGFRGIKSGRLRGEVPPDGKPLELEAVGLSLDPEAAEDGTVSITVDGVEAALRFRVAFARSGDPTTPVLDTSPRLRLRPEPPPTPGQSMRFRAAGDFAPLGSRLDVRLLRTDPGGTTAVEREQEFSAARSRRAAVVIAAGGLTVRPMLKDWEVTWDTPQLIGRRTLQARLLSADGRVLLTEEKPVVLDTSAPAGVAFQNLPPKAKRGESLTVSAAGADPESGIAAVKFFLGKPANNQPPAGTAVVTGTPVAGSSGVWQATLTLPDQPGPVPLGVVFENNAGLVASDAGAVEAVSELPVPPGGISGTLVEGELPQAGLTVTLLDANGKEVKSAMTGADGSFRFDGLAAGQYTLTAQKVGSRRSAKTPVKVEAGKTATVTVKLLL